MSSPNKTKTLFDFLLFRNIPLKSRQPYLYDTFFMAFAGAINGIVAPGFMAMYLRRSLECSDKQIGLYFSLPSIGAFLSLLLPMILKIKGKKKPVLILTFINVWLYVLLAFIMNSTLFILVAVAPIILYTTMNPFIFGIRRANYPSEYRGRMMGKILSIQTIMFSCFLILVGWLTEERELFYRFLFPFAGIFTLGMLFSMKKMRVMDEDENAPPSLEPLVTPAKVLEVITKNYRFVTFILIMFFYTFFIYIAQPLYTLYATDELNISYKVWAWISFGGIVYRIVSIVSVRYIWGRIIDKNPIPMFARGLTITIWSTMPLCYYFAWDEKLIFAATFIGGFCLGGMVINSSLIAMYFGKENTPVYQAYTAISFATMQLIAPNIAPYIRNMFGTKQCFLLVSGGLFISGMMFLAFYVYEKRRLLRQGITKIEY